MITITFPDRATEKRALAFNSGELARIQVTYGDKT